MGMELFFENLIKIGEASDVETLKKKVPLVKDDLIQFAKEEDFGSEDNLYLGKKNSDYVLATKNDDGTFTFFRNKLNDNDVAGKIKIHSSGGKDQCPAINLYTGEFEIASKSEGGAKDAKTVTHITEGVTALCFDHPEIREHFAPESTDKVEDLIELVKPYLELDEEPSMEDWYGSFNEDWITSIYKCSNPDVVNECLSYVGDDTIEHTDFFSVHEFTKVAPNMPDFRFLFNNSAYGMENKDSVQPADVFLVNRKYATKLYEALKLGKTPIEDYAAYKISNGKEADIEKIKGRAGEFDADAYDAYSKLKASKKNNAKLTKKDYAFLGKDDKQILDLSSNRKQSIIYNMNICCIMGWILPISLKKALSDIHVKFSELKIYSNVYKEGKRSIAVPYFGIGDERNAFRGLYLIASGDAYVRPFWKLSENGIEAMNLSRENLPSLPNDENILGIRGRVSKANQIDLELGDGGFGGKTGAGEVVLDRIIGLNEGKTPANVDIFCVFDDYGRYNDPSAFYAKHQYQLQKRVVDIISAFKKGSDKGIDPCLLFSVFIAKCLEYKVYVEGVSETEEIFKEISAINDGICNYFKVC